ncbi:MAG: CesT family type III secretion system chaperone [Candidatus Symbiodolus clandestinus]
MSSRAEALLEDLSQAIGIKELAFDEQRMCSFIIDEQFRVTLLASGEESLLIYGILGHYPEPEPENFALELLTANLLFSEVNGPYVSYEPISRTLLLAINLPLDELDVEALEAQIEYMVQNLEHMIKTLAERNITLTLSA